LYCFAPDLKPILMQRSVQPLNSAIQLIFQTDKRQPGQLLQYAGWQFSLFATGAWLANSNMVLNKSAFILSFSPAKQEEIDLK
jgi:hypothetical protein